MAVGYSSQVVNGQLVNVAIGQSYAPLTFGSAYVGPGFWPRNGVFNVPPVVPSPSTWEGSNTGTGGGPMGEAAAGGYGGGPSSPTWAGMSKDGGVNPFHPTKSPLIFAILFLGIGLWMFNYVHYK